MKILSEIIIKSFSGEWGSECIETDLCVNVIRTTNMRNDGSLNLENTIMREIDKEKIRKKALVHGDILVEKSGGTNTTPVGRVSVMDLQDKSGVFLCNNFIMAIRPNEEIIMSKYLYYNLYYNHKIGMTKKYINKTTGIQNLKTDSYLMQPIYTPPKSKQKKVVEILDYSNNIIEKYKSVLNYYDLLAKSLFNELFGDVLAQKNKKWEKFKLGDITDIISGSTPKTSVNSYWDGELAWITPAEIKEDSLYIYDTERKLTTEGVKAASLTLMPIGTVIFSSRAPIGKLGIAGINMYCNQGFKNFACSSKVNNIYLFWLLKLYKEYFLKLGRGATFKEISKEIIENVQISVPPIVIQDKFATTIEQIDKSKFSSILNRLKYLLYVTINLIMLEV